MLPDKEPYRTAEIRQFLTEAFSDEELATLCFDYFRDVYEGFGSGMGKKEKIQRLIEYHERRDETPRLLAALESARPQQYKERFPQAVQTETWTEPAKPKHDPRQIFISHAYEDAELAHRLALDLQQRDWRVWVAPDSIRPGEKWVDAINRGLEGSGVLVLLLTPAAVGSRWVVSETNVAIELEHQGRLRFLPLDIRNCEMPLLWTEYQRVSFRGRYEDGLETLLGELEPGRRERQAPKRPAQPQPRSAQLKAQSARPQVGAFQPLARPAQPKVGSPQPQAEVIKPKARPPAQSPVAQQHTPAKAAPKFFRSVAWWIALAVLLAVSIGGAFLADWLLHWSLGLFRIKLQPVELGWLALLIAGLVWGLTYSLLDAVNETVPDELGFGFAAPYGEIFDGYDSGDRMRGLFTAVPVNILISWGLAHAGAWAAATLFNAAHNGVVYLVFGAITLMSVAWRIAEDIG